MCSEYNRTYLAIDYGKRRIGLAKSDPLGVIASALGTLEVRSRRDAVAQVRRMIDEYQPNALVIGYPVLSSGDRSPMCDEIDLFLGDLTAFWHGPVHKVDEDYSSSEATDMIHAHGKRVGKDKGRVDRLAAVVILRRFLDEQSRA
jgi:putative Holliday junction resolvase